jgi:hypothetical protein
MGRWRRQRGGSCRTAHHPASSMALTVRNPTRCSQAKSSHFARVDASRYSQLWRLQQREACGLVQQLLAADRVIHEQQLGWGWQPPAQELFVSPHDALVPGDAAAATAAAAAAAADADAGVGAGAGNCAPRSPMTAGSAQLGALSTGSPSSSRASSAGSARRSCGSRTVSSCGAAAVAGEAPCASVGAEADGQAQAEGGRSARRTSQARASPSQHPPGRPEVTRTAAPAALQELHTCTCLAHMPVCSSAPAATGR